MSQWKDGRALWRFRGITRQPSSSFLDFNVMKRLCWVLFSVHTSELVAVAMFPTRDRVRFHSIIKTPPRPGQRMTQSTLQPENHTPSPAQKRTLPPFSSRRHAISVIWKYFSPKSEYIFLVVYFEPVGSSDETRKKKKIAVRVSSGYK